VSFNPQRTFVIRNDILFRQGSSRGIIKAGMPKDPFCEHKLKKVKKDRGYLTKSELEKFIDFKPDSKRLEKVRDIFLFCCFTVSGISRSFTFEGVPVLIR